MHSIVQNIEKLSEVNYEAWEMQRSVLVYNDLWGYTSGQTMKSEAEPAALNWTTKDEKALALIILSISRAELGHIRKVKTSK